MLWNSEGVLILPCGKTWNYANACLSPVLSRSPSIQISGTLGRDKHRSCMELLGRSWCATWTMMHWTRTVPLPFRLDRMSVRACANTTDNNANKCSKIYKSRQAKWYKMIKNKGIYIMNISWVLNMIIVTLYRVPASQWDPIKSYSCFGKACMLHSRYQLLRTHQRATTISYRCSQYASQVGHLLYIHLPQVLPIKVGIVRNLSEPFRTRNFDAKNRLVPNSSE